MKNKKKHSNGASEVRKKNNKAISRTVSSQQTQSDVLREFFFICISKLGKKNFFLSPKTIVIEIIVIVNPKIN